MVDTEKIKGSFKVLWKVMGSNIKQKLSICNQTLCCRFLHKIFKGPAEPTLEPKVAFFFLRILVEKRIKMF